MADHDLTCTMAASTSTSTPKLTLSRALSATCASSVSTSEPNLAVTRALSCTAAIVTSTSMPELSGMGYTIRAGQDLTAVSIDLPVIPSMPQNVHPRIKKAFNSIATWLNGIRQAGGFPVEKDSLRAALGNMTVDVEGNIVTAGGQASADYEGWVIRDNNDVAQLWMDGETGITYAGGGAVMMDQNGIAMPIPSSYYATSSYQFTKEDSGVTTSVAFFAAWEEDTGDTIRAVVQLASGIYTTHILQLISNGKIYLGDGSAFDEVNERLGIGTLSPAYALDVVGSVNVGTDTFRLDGTNKRLSIGSAASADGTHYLCIRIGTAPTGNPANGCIAYTADAGTHNGCPHWRTEDGDVLKLFKGNHIADPSGGSVIDVEARAAIASINSRLETMGVSATS